MSGKAACPVLRGAGVQPVRTRYCGTAAKAGGKRRTQTSSCSAGSLLPTRCVVYKAVDTHLDRPAAIKLLPPDLTRDEDARRRFMREARAASALDHANICTIYEVGETPDGQLFLAMAYYDGATLEERLTRGPLTPDDAVDIATQVARGLARAHDSGIIHRDIKPANIMLTSQGDVKILDFGVAKLLGQTQLTMTGTFLGTAAYMSPEQVRGEEIDTTSISGRWGSCSTRCSRACDRFQATGSWRRFTPSPRQAREVVADLPAELEAVTSRALEKRRDARYQTSAALRDDLERYRQGRSASITATRALRSTADVVQMPRFRTAALAALGLVRGDCARLNRMGLSRWATDRHDDRAGHIAVDERGGVVAVRKLVSRWESACLRLHLRRHHGCDGDLTRWRRTPRDRQWSQRRDDATMVARRHQDRVSLRRRDGNVHLLGATHGWRAAETGRDRPLLFRPIRRGDRRARISAVVPGRRRLVFSRLDPTGAVSLWEVDVDTGQETRLTTAPSWGTSGPLGRRAATGSPSTAPRSM